MPDTVNSPIQTCPNKKKEEETTDPEKKFWIKFKLCNTEDSSALENVVLDLKLPDESPAIVETNDKGEVEIKNIDDGMCHLNIDWKELIEQGITIDQMVLIK